MSNCVSVYKRCQPLMGTFVELHLETDLPKESINTLITEVYSIMNRVAATLSFYDETSELSQLNQAPVLHWIRVGEELREVLACALELQRLSPGFNVAIAGPLSHWGILPGGKQSVVWKHLLAQGFELRGNFARRLLPVKIDLGGIAKGYVVDAGVEYLNSRFASLSGVLNAGGDLRVFGEREFPIGIRTEGAHGPELRTMSLRNAAVATSTVSRVDKHSAYVDVLRGKALTSRRNATAIAKSAMLADAATKIALFGDTDQINSVSMLYGIQMELAA